MGVSGMNIPKTWGYASRTYSDQEQGAFYGAFMAQALLVAGDTSLREVKAAADRAWHSYIGMPEPQRFVPIGELGVDIDKP